MNTDAITWPAERRRLLALARRLLGSTADAEDVVQDAWLRWREADAAALLRPEAWLLTVVRHLAIDRHRAAALHAERLLLQGPGDAADPADEAVERGQDVQAALRRLARRLAPHEAAVVLLREVFEADHAEIAAAWKRSEAACRQAQLRALRRLRDKADRRANDAATEAALYALCLGALVSHRAAPLFALLREAAVQACAAPRANTAPVRSGASTRIVQAGGALAQALLIDGVVVCVLPLGAAQAQAGMLK